MSRAVRLRWLRVALCALACGGLAAAAAEVDVRVAVLAFRGGERALDRWSATMDYLGESIPGHRFTAAPMDLAELDRAVVDGAIEFAITNSGQYVRVGSRHGLSWLATLKSRRHPGRVPVIGSALLVRADSGYHTLADLRGKRLGAVSPLAFGGYQIYAGEMAERGERIDRFFDDLLYSGFPVDALAYWVRDRQVDAAVVPVCLLETMASEGLLRVGEYRVLDRKPIAEFSCATSTALYPNWSFSKLRGTSAQLAERVAHALLLMPADSAAARQAGALGWTAPVSDYDIHQLYQRLDIHPWRQHWAREAWDWLLRHWQWGLVALAVMLLGFLHHLWVQLMVNRRTRDLQRINEELHHQQAQLEHAQRVAILGELASDLAHELNQPLAAINSYAEGGTVRLERDPRPLDVQGLLQRIGTEARRGAQIIQRIRGFARREPLRRQPTDLNQLVRETLALLGHELKRARVDPTVQLPEPAAILAVDAIEIQQLLVNLVRNSLDALADTTAPRTLVVGLSRAPPRAVRLTVEDNGAGIDEAQVETLFKPFYSTRPQGLGLGMSICRRIVEAHGGRIELKSVPSGGTLVTCTISGGDDE